MKIKFILAMWLIFTVSKVEISACAEKTIQWKQENHIAYYDDKLMKIADPYLKEKCHLNIEYPENQKGFATMIFIHGGGLRKGSPGAPESYHHRNFALVTPGYRLAPEVKCPVYIEDVAAATAWVLKNIHRFGGNPNKVFLAGGSGGGYLAAMVGMDGKYLGKYGLKPQQLAGVIPISGQLTTHMTVKKERNIPFTRQIIDEYAPIYYAASNLSPFLVVVGDADLEWPARTQENAFFVAVMKAAGHKKTTFYELKGLNHGTIYDGAITQICEFIVRTCNGLDQRKTPTTYLVDPKVSPSMDKEIEEQIEKQYDFPPWTQNEKQ